MCNVGKSALKGKAPKLKLFSPLKQGAFKEVHLFALFEARFLHFSKKKKKVLATGS